MKLTKPQNEVMTGLKNGRGITYRHYNSAPAGATWDDEPWSPYQKNWAVVIRALLKKNLVAIKPDPKAFHVFSVELVGGDE
jgi:hypothetical protein